MNRTITFGFLLVIVSGCVTREYYPYQPAQGHYYGYQPGYQQGYQPDYQPGGGVYTGSGPVVRRGVQVPSVTGMDLRSASDVLAEADLLLGDIGYRQMQGMEGRVASQKPAAGTTVSPYFGVDVIVGVPMQRMAVPNLIGLTPLQARQALQSVGLIPGRVTYRETPWIRQEQVIQQSVRPGTFLTVGAQVSYVVGTRGRGLQTPDVVGMTVIEARRELRKAGLSLGSVSTVPAPRTSAGKILAQEPAADASVNYGATVNVQVGEAYSLVQVPALSNLNRQRAEKTLNEAGLRLGNVGQEPNARPPLVVVSQSPPPGRSTVKGSAVDITLGSRMDHRQKPRPEPRPAITVPDVTRWEEKSAVSYLESLGFKVSVQRTGGRTTGMVVRQSPSPGVKLPKGSEVTIYVPGRGRGPEKKIIAVPLVVRMNIAAARTELHRLGLRVAREDKVPGPADIVIAQSPAPGVEVPHGSGVALRIGAGDGHDQRRGPRDRPDKGKPGEGRTPREHRRSTPEDGENDKDGGKPGNKPEEERGPVKEQKPEPKEPPKATVPDLSGMSRGQARGALRKAGLSLGRIHFVASDKPNTVLKQGVPAGSELKKGSRVDVWVGFKAD